jgi:hypothetical protein
VPRLLTRRLALSRATAPSDTQRYAWLPRGYLSPIDIVASSRNELTITNVVSSRRLGTQYRRRTARDGTSARRAIGRARTTSPVEAAAPPPSVSTSVCPRVSDTDQAVPSGGAARVVADHLPSSLA